jgi:hypothetical protein
MSVGQASIAIDAHHGFSQQIAASNVRRPFGADSNV